MNTAEVRVVVSAAVIERDGRYLVTRRLAGTHLEGYWEFPGGKCSRNETIPSCLAREIHEELGCAVDIGAKLFCVSHSYPDRTIELHFYRCTALGEPKPMLGQEIRWVAPAELKSLSFPPADEELIQLLAG